MVVSDVLPCLLVSKSALQTTVFHVAGYPFDAMVEYQLADSRIHVESEIDLVKVSCSGSTYMSEQVHCCALSQVCRKTIQDLARPPYLAADHGT